MFYFESIFNKNSSSLLDKVPQVPTCPSIAQVAECLTTQVPWVPKCSSSTQALFECASALSVLYEYPLSALQLPLSVLRVNKVCNITGSGLICVFVEFLKNHSEYIFCITLIVDCFLKNKMPNFCHVLQVRYNHSKEFQKFCLNNLLSVRVLDLMNSKAHFLTY